jgi:hypothetical protein
VIFKRKRTKRDQRGDLNGFRVFQFPPNLKILGLAKRENAPMILFVFCSWSERTEKDSQGSRETDKNHRGLK